jgi:hypothetical protein
MKNFYVYYSYEEWGRGYIGKRECYCLPEEDVKYFGSFTDKSFKPTQKIVLATFETREEAFAAEIALHGFYKVEKNSHFANKARQTSTGFYSDATGRKKSEKERRDIAKKMRRENLSPETRIKRSQSLKEHYSNPSVREESSRRAREIGSRPETKLKRSIAAKRVALDPEVTAKRRESYRDTISTEESAIRRRKAALERERVKKLNKKGKNPKVQQNTLRQHSKKNEEGKSIFAINVGKAAHKEKDENGKSKLGVSNGKKALATLINRNPNHQRDASLKCHKKKDEFGRSLHALESYKKGLALVPLEEQIARAEILNTTLYYDPNHPEIGFKSAGTLAKIQKARGYPYGSNHRVKVNIDESESN